MFVSLSLQCVIKSSSFTAYATAPAGISKPLNFNLSTIRNLCQRLPHANFHVYFVFFSAMLGELTKRQQKRALFADPLRGQVDVNRKAFSRWVCALCNDQILMSVNAWAGNAVENAFKPEIVETTRYQWWISSNIYFSQKLLISNEKKINSISARNVLSP